MSDQFRRVSAIADFRQARQKAGLAQALADLRGQSTELLLYEAVTRQLGQLGSSERGLRDIPIDAIAGSVGRTQDFTRDFLPRLDSDLERWTKVRMVAGDPGSGGMPPIKVYQVGQAYFILDGHHRVSVARALKATHIQAYVTEVRTKAPLSAAANPDELIARAESVAFLEATGLDRSRSRADLSLTTPGDAEHLARQVELQRQSLAAKSGAEVLLSEAAEHWYDTVYEPVVKVLREQGLLRLFPDHTEADLYLTMSAHRRALEEALGWEITPEVGATNLAAQQSVAQTNPLIRAGRRLYEAVVPGELRPGPEAGVWRRERTTARYSDRLFADILVPLSGKPECWPALDLALRLAAREDAHVHGLHVVRTRREQTGAAALAVRDEFDRACQAVGMSGTLAVEVGAVGRKICELSTLSDLVVLNLAHPPGKPILARLSSGFRAVVRRCPRPVLVVPRAAQPPGHIVLAYDGSPKAEEALFVAAYFAETWKTPLTVVTALPARTGAGGISETTLDHARQYLEMHEVQAVFDVRHNVNPAEAILAAAEANAADLILMGGYGGNPLVEVALGSAVDQVLRRSTRPMLICQ